MNQTAGLLTAAGVEAVATLQSLLAEAESDQVRLSAAKAILDLGGRLRESSEVLARLDSLETLLSERRPQTEKPRN